MAQGRAADDGLGGINVMRIACLHTAESNIAVFDQALAALDRGNTISLRHIVRADLLADAEQAGGLTHDIAAQTRSALEELSGDADAVLLTCSTLGPSIHADERAAILRVDAALAEEAVRE